MEISVFKTDYLTEMAELFVQNFKCLRSGIPLVPDVLENTGRVTQLLSRWLASCPGLVALDHGKVVGYLGWYRVDGFRGTDRKAAYCPEWGHAAAATAKAEIYRALYHTAAEQWFAAGCQTHALTLLAQDTAAEKVWFWNGFGLTVVDAIRPMQPPEISAASGLQFRKATLEDVPALVELEAEHAQHYQQPPVLMMAYAPKDAATLTEFMNEPANSLWLALAGKKAVGYMRFEASNETAILDTSDNITITGAFIRPECRGRKAGAALLSAAIQDYADQGYQRCSVNFESFNPEAAGFWMRYFEPVCLSVIRVPEKSPLSA
ncbi:MAG TPA: GNAT family N-acetyltransferase [Phototrophicaceae bacterium]|nr:GNAT family N-acetyltransferase [Phototrophicaceae bacterium]